MPLRNGQNGYGVVAKVLHLLTVIAIAGQFLVGWAMQADDDAFDREKAASMRWRMRARTAPRNRAMRRRSRSRTTSTAWRTSWMHARTTMCPRRSGSGIS